MTHPISAASQNTHGQNQQTGGYGNTVKLLTGNTQPVPILNLPAGFRLAQTFTVEFGIIPPTTAAGSPSPVNCVATIQWVENGQQVQRQVTVGNGVTVSGSGTGIQVSLSDIPIGSTYVSNLPYQVTALLAPGLRPALNFLPLLITAIAPGATTVTAIAAGATLTVPIPQNAGVRAVEVTAIGNGAGNVADVTVSADAGGGSLKTWAPNGSPQMTSLPSACLNLVISNRSATIGSTVTVLWGIDG